MPDPVTTMASSLTSVTRIVSELSSLLSSDSFRRKKELDALLETLRRSTSSLKVVVSLAASLLDIEDAIDRINTDIKPAFPG